MRRSHQLILTAEELTASPSDPHRLAPKVPKHRGGDVGRNASAMATGVALFIYFIFIFLLLCLLFVLFFH